MSTSDPTLADWCRDNVERYLAVFPTENQRLLSFRSLLETDTDHRSRTSVPGHITASGMLWDPAQRQVFLIHHTALNTWLQPGGHLENDELPPTAARREVAEEVGLKVDRLLSIHPDTSVPIDIDSHQIPANDRKAEPAHTHHDLMFAFEVSRVGSSVSLQAEEVSDGRWFSHDDAQLEPRLRRVVEKLLHRQLWPISVGPT